METFKNYSYIAGFFDGEGCIYVAKAMRNYEYQKNYRCFYLSLTITNTDLETLEWIIKVMGFGKIYKRPPSKKQCYVYRLGKMKEILEFLKRIYPYLRTKREKARLVMEYCQLRLSKLEKKYNARFGIEEEKLQRKIMGA